MMPRPTSSSSARGAATGRDASSTSPDTRRGASAGSAAVAPGLTGEAGEAGARSAIRRSKSRVTLLILPGDASSRRPGGRRAEMKEREGNAGGAGGGAGEAGQAAHQEPGAERLASRTVFAGRRIEVRVDRLRLPGGAEHDFEMIHHPGAAAIVPLFASGEVLMLRQYRYATGGWLLEVPAGTLEPGESPEHCAARELQEETGYRAGALQPLGWIWTTPGFTDERIWLFLATDLAGGRQALERDELLTLERLPLARAAAMAAGGEIVDGKSVAALLRAAGRPVNS